MIFQKQEEYSYDMEQLIITKQHLIYLRTCSFFNDATKHKSVLLLSKICKNVGNVF